MYLISVAVYRLTFHPLASFPGPLSHRISVWPRAILLARGDLPFHVAKLHARYGPVVRLGPNELAFANPQAWKDIYGHRQAGQDEFPKSPKLYKIFDDLPTSIITAGREEHSLLRRQMAHGFSDRSMRGQEPIIGAYVDLLVQRLQSKCDGGRTPLNSKYFSFTRICTGYHVVYWWTKDRLTSRRCLENHINCQERKQAQEVCVIYDDYSS